MEPRAEEVGQAADVKKMHSRPNEHMVLHGLLSFYMVYYGFTMVHYGFTMALLWFYMVLVGMIMGYYWDIEGCTLW